MLARGGVVSMKLAHVVSIPVVALAVIWGCAGTTQKASPPSTWTYEIDFKSKDAAISADTVDVKVFDATKPEGDCQKLFEKRRTGQELPTPIADSQAIPICDVLAGKGSITTTYGTFSLLAVAKRGAKDWLIGCSTQTVGEAEPDPAPTVGLTLFDNTVAIVPASACGSVTQYCKAQCVRP